MGTNNILEPECGQILKSLSRSTPAEHMKLTYSMERKSNVDSEWRYGAKLNRGKRDSKTILFPSTNLTVLM